MSSALEKTVERARRLLDLDYTDVAGALRVHPSTLYRWRTGDVECSERSRNRSAALAHLLDQVEHAFPDPDELGPWLDAPLPGFAGDTPRQLLRRGRTEILVGYLMRGRIDVDRTDRRRALSRTRLLADAGAIFAELSEAKEVLDRVARLMTGTVADFAIAYLLQENGRLDRVARVHRDPDQERLLEEFARRVPLTGPYALPDQLFESGDPILLDSVEVEALATGPDHARLIRDLAPASGIGVPMMGPRGPLGIFAVGTVRGGRPAFAEADRTTVAEIARRAALALENERLRREEREAWEAAREQARRISALQHATAALTRALTPEEVRAALVDEAASSLGAVGGALILASDEGGWLDVTHSFVDGAEGIRDEWSRIPATPERPTPATEVFCTGEPIFISSPTQWKNRYPHLGELVAELGGRSVAYVPVEVEDRRSGVLALRFPEEREFPDDERLVFLSLGQLAAQGLERARLFESERAARVEAEVASVARSQFLSVVSHELRTPLNGILGSASLLEEEIPGVLNEAQHEHVRRIGKGAEHLTSLIDEILSYSRADPRREEPDLSRVDVSELAREAGRLLGTRAADEGLELKLRLPEEPVEAVTDPGKLRHVLLHLLNNAIKFTDQGTVELGLTSVDGCVEFSVRDTGPGIPADQRKRIFEPFVQVDQSRTRTRGGTGLGLAVVARQVEILGGRVTVESEPGEGSVFRVRYPAGKREAPWEDGR